MSVAQILKGKGNNIFSVVESQTVMTALQVMTEYKIGVVLVKDQNGELVGVASERDVARNLPNRGGALLDDSIASIMTRDVIVCKPSDSIEDIMALMTSNKIRHLPVMNGKDLIGIISIGDVVKQRIAETELEAESLKAYITAG